MPSLEGVEALRKGGRNSEGHLEKDYRGNPGSRYPVNPALNIPYPMPDSDFALPVYPTRNKFPNYPGNPDRDAGVPSYPWVLTAPGAPLYHIPSFPIPSWLSRHPLLPWAFRLVPPSKRPMGPYFPPDTAAPTAADPHVPKPLAPLTTNPPTIPEIEPPAVTEPDEAEPAAAAPVPQPSTSLDQSYSCDRERCRSRKETQSLHKQTYTVSAEIF
ncbi:hypothetical protein E2I00_017171 [Balaenoptera physalus]|uniref:Proline-rich protein 27 n=1 Tax=Balaenoptera physalus TaxID=9770 RepID=A0A6A1QDZ0_BALPH|nr:hypothetical protein E2I00_017171 [Balaenoptera physalus]